MCGTHTSTGNYILIEAHFEPPFGMFTFLYFSIYNGVISSHLYYFPLFLEYTIEDVTEFSRNLDLLNNYIDQEKITWQPEHQDPSKAMQQYSLYCKLYSFTFNLFRVRILL